MASMQTVLTAWMTNNQVVTLALNNGQAVSGQITDDGAGGDTIEITSKNSLKTYIPKVAITTLPDPADISVATPPGKGTNSQRLV